MKQQLNEQLNRIRQIIESIEDYDFEKTSYDSNNVDDTIDITKYKDTERDMIQDIHFVGKSEDNNVVVGMTLFTFVPTEDGSNKGKEVKINSEIEWEMRMTPFENFPGVDNTNFYIKSVRKMEFNPKIHPTLENLFKRYFNEGTMLKDLLRSLYNPYIIFIISKDGDSSNVTKSMNKNVDIIKDIIKDNL